MIVRCIKAKGTNLQYHALYEVCEQSFTRYRIGDQWHDKVRFEILPDPWLPQIPW